MSTKRLTEIAMMTAVIAVLAPLSIPLAGQVPISLATFAVMLAGVLLGPKDGTICAVLYLVLGAIGVPVFAGWTGGIAKLVSVTGGFLIGYIPLAFFSGLIYHKFGKAASGFQKYIWMFVGMLLGNIVLYSLGIIWFVFVTKSTVSAALAACVIPFIPGDFIKMVVVALLAPRLEPVIAKFKK